MNRVWKIIEERKSGSQGTQGMTDYRGMAMGRRGMSGRRGGNSYEEGVKDGMCAALDILEDHIKDLDKE